MVEKECKHHGFTPHRYEGKARHIRCIRCRTERVTKARQDLKRDLVTAKGSKCEECGYSKSIWAFEFHHIDPSLKEHSMGGLIRDRKRKLAFTELQKCQLLCGNCHAEAEEKMYLQKLEG